MCSAYFPEIEMCLQQIEEISALARHPVIVQCLKVLKDPDQCQDFGLNTSFFDKDGDRKNPDLTYNYEADQNISSWLFDSISECLNNNRKNNSPQNNVDTLCCYSGDFCIQNKATDFSEEDRTKISAILEKLLNHMHDLIAR